MPERTDTAADDRAGTATQVFVDRRELLFAIAYNMLGSVTDTEDVLQDTWLSWTGRTGRARCGGIDNPRACLVRIAVNHALARRADITRRRETYVGPWLPEPLVDKAAPDDYAEHALRAESVSLAMLVVLESLTPLERAVFVLNEAFEYAHTEIADVLDRSPAAVRQQATERFVQAAPGGNITTLMEILAPDVTVWTDGGGKAPAGPRPVHGRNKAAPLPAGCATRRGADFDIRYQPVNGDDSAVVFEGESPYAVMEMDPTPEGDQMSEVFIVTNPDRFTRAPRDERATAEEERA
ncbi:sigma factor-like helix-turn-helix DNA-binding protein [Streptomyces sp. NPDC052107]|uniref:sigma factor-like helix-turn-helix DNA-binding protein n=1 Tax=Streptomyces sp. NPDC052107 TaxID=3155632 RepID=UPI00341FC987